MEDYFSTLTKEEIEENLRLWEEIQKARAPKTNTNTDIIPKKLNIISNTSDRSNGTQSILPKRVMAVLPNTSDRSNGAHSILPNYLDNLPDNDHARCFKIGYEQLNDFQKDIFHECVVKNQSNALSLPLGSGKTIISIVLSLYMNIHSKALTLVIVSKSLVNSWETEISKFFGKQLNYEVIHPSNTKNINKWKIANDTILLITTIDVLAGSYKDNHVDKMFIDQRFVNHTRQLGSYINYYNIPDKPYIDHVIGKGLFYSDQWGCLIVDEVQTYTNIETLRCQALGALCCKYRWLLSGTLFDEPKPERILGYHIILNAPNMPRCLPETKDLLKSDEFKGLNEHIIYREENIAFIPPKLNDIIITHDLCYEEAKIYTMMKEILVILRNKAETARLNNDTARKKLFNSYKLVMIMYLRQAIICPLVPITSVIIDASDAEKKSVLADMILTELKNLNIDDYLNDVNSVKSTRIKSALSILDKHDEKCIVMSCFVSCLDILRYFLDMNNNNTNKIGRPVFCLTSDMNLTKRGELLSKFEESKNGILLSTYELAGSGLNLQHCRTLLLMDYWWSAKCTKQSIGRIFRYGQKADEVFIYFFSSNTGIEKIIFEKQNAKLMIVEELTTGKQKTDVPKIKMDDIIKLIESEQNRDLLCKIQKRMY
jgi:SNF2 family DNA or RNA helicase